MTQIRNRTRAPGLTVRWQRPAPSRRLGLQLGRLGAGLVAAQGGRLIASWINRRIVGKTAAGTAVGDGAGWIGRGILAGMAGTVAITAAAMADQLVRKAIDARREGKPLDYDFRVAMTAPWKFGAEAAGKLLALMPPTDEARRRLALAVHWSYGTIWGAGLGLIELAGLRGPAAIGALLGGVLGTEFAIWPALGLYDSPTQWGPQAVATTLYQEALYAVSAALVFETLLP